MKNFRLFIFDLIFLIFFFMVKCLYFIMKVLDYGILSVNVVYRIKEEGRIGELMNI